MSVIYVKITHLGINVSGIKTEQCTYSLMMTHKSKHVYLLNFVCMKQVV